MWRGRAVKNVTRNIEVWMVEQVEEIAAKLQAAVFGAERHTFGQTEIEIRESGPGENIPALSPEQGKTGSTHRRTRKGTRIEPVLLSSDLAGAAPTGAGLKWAGDQIRSRRISECGSG